MKRIVVILAVFLAGTSYIIPNGAEFKWRFDKFKKLTFDFEQSASMESGFSDNVNMNMFNKLEGKLIVKVKSRTLADIVLTDLSMTTYRVDSLGDTSIMATQSFPELFIQDLKEDGTIEGPINNQNELLARTLFPVMNKHAEVGDSTDLRMTLPFNLFGSIINIKGYNRVKYVGSNDGVEKLETIINVSDYSIPDEVKTKYTCYMKGDSRFDFHSQKGYFTNGLVNLNMVLKSESSGESKSMLDMSMNMKTTIRLQLLSAE